MKKTIFVVIIIIAVFLTACVTSTYFAERNTSPPVQTGDEKKEEKKENEKPPAGDEKDKKEEETPEPPEEERITFEYPGNVRGIYVTAHSAGGERFKNLVKLVDETELNAMVIDIKEDHGYVTFELKGTPFDEYSRSIIKDPKKMLKTLSEHGIYPIARIVVFKDSVLAERHPEYSFKTSKGAIWRNRRKEAFVNPFISDVWKHNVEIAKIAAEMGFPEIQFDYVRFPEGFERREKYLSYSCGDYSEEKLLQRLKREWESLPRHLRDPEPPVYDRVQARVTAITDFVEYAYKELKPLGVDVSVDIFGYTATLREAPGIGQNFTEIAKHVDVICSMIYPSHWGFGYFGIPKPDKDPYRLVAEYVKAEREKLSELDNPPVSRPWIQDFTAPWLKKGNYIVYGKEEVEAQIKALNEGGIKEFLLWNPGNSYTRGVDYTPELAVKNTDSPNYPNN